MRKARKAAILAVLVLALTSSRVRAGGLKVVIREWDVPTPDSRPHDPEAAPDGALWYTGQVTEYPMPDARVRDPHSLAFDRDGIIFFTAQQSNFVGRLDTKTGKVTVKEVPTPHALPYGIIVGPDGAAYFCEFGSNKIGRIDPATLDVKEYTLPEGARPRRIANNPDRLIYYSDFARGYVGRLDPRSGKVEEWASPGGARSQPYGIASTSDGTVWYSEAGVEPNTLVAFDPKRKSFQKWPIPSGGGVVRNMVATPDGKLYLACSGVNKVAIATVTR
jgi:virginiamycin B lyase